MRDANPPDLLGAQFETHHDVEEDNSQEIGGGAKETQAQREVDFAARQQESRQDDEGRGDKENHVHRPATAGAFDFGPSQKDSQEITQGDLGGTFVLPEKHRGCGGEKGQELHHRGAPRRNPPVAAKDYSYPRQKIAAHGTEKQRRSPAEVRVMGPHHHQGKDYVEAEGQQHELPQARGKNLAIVGVNFATLGQELLGVDFR